MPYFSFILLQSEAKINAYARCLDRSGQVYGIHFGDRQRKLATEYKLGWLLKEQWLPSGKIINTSTEFKQPH